MHLYLLIKTLHILSATVLFGTGIGIAFFMFRSQFTQSLIEKYYAAQQTVIADYWFTFPAVMTQLVTGVWLVSHSGYQWNDLWLVISYGLYVLAGLCWLPVVWIQLRLRQLLRTCIEQQSELPAQYNQLFKVWCVLGCPAFAGLIVVFFVMVTKPI